MKDLDRYRGCLIGGAVGDALGYAVEFMREEDIFTKYGNKGITEYDLTDGVARISDDTQMTLFTATGLLLGTTRGRMRGIMGPYPGYIALAYQDWFRTQTEPYPLPDEFHYSWLVHVPELFHQRAPGNTCMEAIARGADGTIESPMNQSKGCGGIMRVAPIGLYFEGKRLSPEDIDRMAAKAAALTHGHELGYIPAAALVHVIHQIVHDPDITLRAAVEDSLETMKQIFPDAEHLYEFIGLANKAVELSELDVDDLDAIHALGQGWVAEETFAIAVYCALKHSDDFASAVIAAVNHAGDSDSTGALAGTLVGAHLGLASIPERFLRHLELKDVILELADDLYYDCQMSEYGSYYDPVWESKYIRVQYRGKQGGDLR